MKAATGLVDSLVQLQSLAVHQPIRVLDVANLFGIETATLETLAVDSPWHGGRT